MKSLLLISSLLLIMPLIINDHYGRTDIRDCHNNIKTGIYHCHNGSTSNKGGLSENYYNATLVSFINSLTEVSFSFIYKTIGNRNYSGSIRIDIVKDKYVIEGEKDKRSILDSIQQSEVAT